MRTRSNRSRLPRSPRIRRVGAVAVTALMALAGCNRDRAPWYGTTAPKHGPNELWVNNSTEPEWIDPGKASDAIGGTIIHNTFEGLLDPDPRTMMPVPGVAERWEVAEEGRVYTFHLRDDARWSDGSPVTASDFVWSWARVLDPATGAKYADQLYSILNAEAVHRRAIHLPAAAGEQAAREAVAATGEVEKVAPDGRGGWMVFPAKPETREAFLASERAASLGARIADDSMLGLDARGDRLLVVTLQDPIPYFLPMITTLSAYLPVPRQVLEKLRAEGKEEALWTRPEHFVSNGPFVLTEWTFRQRMIFEKNPHYWDRESVRLDRVVVRMVESYTTALQMYKAGEFDFTGENGALPAEYIPHLRTKKDFHVAPWLAIYWYWFNVKAEGVDDPRVRRALNMAVDKQALVEHVLRQGQIPATTIIKGGLAGYVEAKGDGYDPEAARRLLAEAGHPGGKGLPPLYVTFNTSETHRAVAEAVQEMWRRELGVDARLQNQEWSVFLGDLDAKQFQIARLGWIGDYPDPYSFLSVFLGDSANNRSNWRSDRFDGLLARSNREIDPEKRMALLREAEQMLLDDMVAMPLYFYTRARLVKPYVRGVHSNFLDRHPWKAIWIDDSGCASTDPDGKDCAGARDAAGGATEVAQ